MIVEDIKFERLPVLVRPGFDCRNDNANCPWCSKGRLGDHGIYGGSFWFGVAADVEGRRMALVLDVLGIAYPPTVTRPLIEPVRRPRGGALVLHRHADDGEQCEFLKTTCTHEIGGYLRAGELYEQHGNMSDDPATDFTQQSDVFWRALEAQFVRWCLPQARGAA